MPEEPGRSTPDTPRDPGFVASPGWWGALERNDLPLEGRVAAPPSEPEKGAGRAPRLRDAILISCLALVAALTVAIVFGPEIMLACAALGGATVTASLLHRRHR